MMAIPHILSWLCTGHFTVVSYCTSRLSCASKLKVATNQRPRHSPLVLQRLTWGASGVLCQRWKTAVLRSSACVMPLFTYSPCRRCNGLGPTLRCTPSASSHVRLSTRARRQQWIRQWSLDRPARVWNYPDHRKFGRLTLKVPLTRLGVRRPHRSNWYQGRAN